MSLRQDLFRGGTFRCAAFQSSKVVPDIGMSGHESGDSIRARASVQIIRDRRYLQPGQLIVAGHPLAVTTILGSCVAVCVWDPIRRIGGINHFMLPIAAGPASASPRFGDVAMAELLDQMCAAGARTPFLQAHVYGGACMFPQMQSSAHLGQKNVDLAVEYLFNRSIEVVKKDVGGTRGRKLTFHIDEGTVCSKWI